MVSACFGGILSRIDIAFQQVSVRRLPMVDSVDDVDWAYCD